MCVISVRTLLWLLGIVICNIGLCSDNLQTIFTAIYHNHAWKPQQGSVSGTGSSLEQTATIRREIPQLLRQFSIKTLLDAPCGDFNWMQATDISCLDAYIGMDIVAELIAKNNEAYGDVSKIFVVGNIVTDQLPCVDLILCRDCFVHLSFENIKKAMRNFKKSGSKYLLTTSYVNNTVNTTIHDQHTGYWTSLNLQKPPFNFPAPLAVINEHATDWIGVNDLLTKSLALWRIEDLPID